MTLTLAVAFTALAWGAFAAPAQAVPLSWAEFFGNTSSAGSPLPGEFKSATGTAVNSVGAGPADAGDIYVADTDNQRIQRFSSTGQFELMWGKDVVVPGGAGGQTVAANERQRVALVVGPPPIGAVNGGTFTLTFDRDGAGGAPAETTAEIAFNAPATGAGSVQEALEGLSSIGAGDVAVSGGPASPWDVDFTGTLAATDVAQMTGANVSLTTSSGFPASVSVTTTAPGGQLPTHEVCANASECKAGERGSLGGELDDPVGIAVDQSTGNVYVIERVSMPGAAARVQAFTGDGQFLWAIGRNVIKANPAVNTDLGDVFEVCTHTPDCQAASVGSRGGEFGSGGSHSSSGGANGIAVSPVINPITGTGNIVVTDRGNRRVQELTSTGGFVRAFGRDVVQAGGTGDDAVAPVNEFEICTVASECKAGVAGTGDGQFGTNTPNRVAVDSTGAIYTVENSANRRVQKFTPQAGPPALSPSIFAPGILSGTGSTNTPLAVAIGSDDDVFVLKAFPAGAGTPPAASREIRVLELDSAGTLIDTHGAQGGVTDPPAGGYLAVNTVSGKVYVVAEPLPQGFLGVYVLGESLPPSVSMGVDAVGSHGAQLKGLVNPGGPGTPIGFSARYHFEYRQAGAADWIALSEDRDAGSGFAAVPVSESLGGLAADTDYEARLVASKAFSGVASVETAAVAFATLPSAPDIDAVFVTDREQTGATLNARINPNGEATSYRFEYGTTAAYGTTVPVPDGSAGAGTASQVFSEAISGLQPGITYHYRVTATNAHGTSRSADQTFATATVQSAPQPAYELVSPPDKVGGSGLSNWYQGPGSHGNAGTPALVGDRYIPYTYYGASLADGGFAYASDATLAQRTAAGWANRPAFNRMGGIASAEFAKLPALTAASDALSLTAWEANSQMMIFEGQVPNSKGQALRDWESGRWEIMGVFEPGQLVGQDVITAVARGGGHTLSARLRGVAGPGDPTNPAFSGSLGDYLSGGNVYVNDVSAGLEDSFPGTVGDRSLANVCTGGGAARTAIPTVDGDGRLVPAECPPALPDRDARLISPRGASFWQGTGGTDGLGHISHDGSRAFFVSPALSIANDAPCTGTGAVGTACPPQVYVRQRNQDGSVTVRWISRSAIAGQDAGLLATAVLEAATPDGDKVFFRTASPLTADDPNGGNQVPGGVRTGVADRDSVDLYMYDFPDAPGADPGEGTLTRISAGPTGAGDPNVSSDTSSFTSSSLRAVSDDGSRAYFVTAAPLPNVHAASGTITNPGGTTGQAATRNLYAYDAGKPAAQRWRFVAQLPAQSTLGTCAATGSRRGPAPLFTNANGIGGGFQLGGLTNCVRTTADGSFMTLFTDGRLTAGDPDDVSGDIYAYDARIDELVRASAPQGVGGSGSYVCVTPGPSDTGTACHADPAVTSVGTPAKALLGLIMDPSDPDDRTAYFQSAGRLVPEDVNDKYDVYQWRNGVLSLVSTGAAGADDALYRGNDRTGTNVYFSTRDRLTWQDHDAVLDVYTARVGGGIPQPPRPPGCDLIADACQGPGIGVPTKSQIASDDLSGDGNVVSGPRKRVTVGRLSRAQRRKASRSGVLRVPVRVSKAGKVRAVARGRIGKRTRRVGRDSVRVRKAGKVTLKLRLNRAARRRLSRGKALKLSVKVASPGARSRSMTVRLPGAKS